MKKALILAFLVSMSGCGPLNEGRGTPELFKQVRNQISSNDTAPAAPSLPPEVMNAGPGEVLVVTLRARNAVAPMLRAGQNGDRITWISPGKISMTFEDDLLISTRGLGDDLMGADVDGIRAAIAAGQGSATRTHSYIDSLDQIQTIELACEITTEGTEEVPLLSGPRTLRKVVESCRSRRLSFDNTYWLSGNKIVKSRQAIARSQGFIDVEPL